MDQTVQNRGRMVGMVGSIGDDACVHDSSGARTLLGSSLVIEDVELAMVGSASQEAQPDRPPCRLLMLS